MKAEQIGRPDREPSLWRHAIKAVSQLFMPGVHCTGCHCPQYPTATSSIPQTINAISYLTSAVPSAPWFYEKNITCKSLLFYVLKIFFTYRLYCSQRKRYNINKLFGLNGRALVNNSLNRQKGKRCAL
jgi:hypothetical protein